MDMQNPIHLSDLPDAMVADIRKTIKEYEFSTEHVYIVFDNENHPKQWYYSILNASVKADSITGTYVMCLL